MEFDHVQVLGFHGYLTIQFCYALLIVFAEIPLADTGSLTTGPSVDEQATFEIDRLRKPTWRIGGHISFP